MTPLDTHANSFRGLFTSMMGFTSASTQFTLRFLFTAPDKLVDRVRETLENLSNALKQSLDDTNIAGEASSTPAAAADALGGRKRQRSRSHRAED